MKLFRIGAMVAVLAGCGPLVDLPGQGEPPNFYRLSAPDTTGAQSAEGAAVVMIETPSVPGDIAGSDIAIRGDGHRIQFLDGARWTDRTPDMLRRYLVTALRNAGPIRGIDGREDIDVQAGYRLRVDVERFHGRLSGNPQVEVHMAATLLRNGPVTLMADRAFTVTRSAGSTSAEALVSAFDNAMDAIVSDMTQWLQGELPAPPA